MKGCSELRAVVVPEERIEMLPEERRGGQIEMVRRGEEMLRC